jgi:hypothetical protein
LKTKQILHNIKRVVSDMLDQDSFDFLTEETADSSIKFDPDGNKKREEK